MTQLLLPSFFLSLFGIFSLFGIDWQFFFRQTIYVIFGFLIFFVVKKIGSNFFYHNSQFFYWFFVFILILTYFLGLEVKGSRRWLDFYFFRFQPSEFFKVFFCLFLSVELSRRYLRFKGIVGFLKIFLLFIIPGLIIFKQPDLANTVIVFFIYLVMVFFSEFPKKYIVYLMSLIVLVMPLTWFLLADYQKSRIISFLNPHIDAKGTAYNMIQSVITIGSGKFWGRGLGLGTQSRLYFLPENHTDFAFATLVEQFGFFGGALVVIFYGVIIYLIASRAVKFYFQKEEESKKKFLFTLGILSYFVSHVVVNMGMNLGLLPIAGVALPFISYGGSSLVAILIGFALIP
ncbi:MAG: FtsW/RodA/SpoVE family cell cycle protein [Microgenomates group bacterium]